MRDSLIFEAGTCGTWLAEKLHKLARIKSCVYAPQLLVGLLGNDDDALSHFAIRSEFTCFEEYPFLALPGCLHSSKTLFHVRLLCHHSCVRVWESHRKRRVFECMKDSEEDEDSIEEGEASQILSSGASRTGRDEQDTEHDAKRRERCREYEEPETYKTTTPRCHLPRLRCVLVVYF
jgi:hypothetical protein